MFVTHTPPTCDSMNEWNDDWHDKTEGLLWEKTVPMPGIDCLGMNSSLRDEKPAANDRLKIAPKTTT
jgi:hypothetical protein